LVLSGLPESALIRADCCRYYEDFIRPLDPTLPSLSLRNFCSLIFQHCPLLSQFSEYHAAAYAEFLAYKTRIPVRGAILLNESMDQAVLVKGWKKGSSWSFPRGKINKDEKDLDCAIREVYEETGYDIREAGLVEDEEAVKYIDVTLREQQIRLYVFRGVPMDTHFEPKTRKEISVSRGIVPFSVSSDFTENPMVYTLRFAGRPTSTTRI
jgi:mRNA-decapping enzyme subunit 2